LLFLQSSNGKNNKRLAILRIQNMYLTSYYHENQENNTENPDRGVEEFLKIWVRGDGHQIHNKAH